MESVYVAVEISSNFQSIKPEFEAENMLKIDHFLKDLDNGMRFCSIRWDTLVDGVNGYCGCILANSMHWD